VCSCLLQPKCLHVAAVIAVLEPAEASGADTPAVAAPAAVAAAEPMSSGAVPAARDALRVCGDVLATGAEASGAFVQSGAAAHDPRLPPQRGPAPARRGADVARVA
jgi:hypothetical protein